MAIKVNDSDFMNSFLLDMLTSLSINASTLALIEKSIEDNGIYNASDDNADGYSSVAVNVAGSYSLPSDTELASANCKFKDGVLVVQDTAANAQGGIRYPLNISPQAGDVLETKLHMYITNPLHTSADCNVFCFENNNIYPFCRFDLYQANRFGYGDSNSTEHYSNLSGNRLSIGECFILATMTFSSDSSYQVEIKVSSDDVTYTSLGTKTVNNGSAIHYDNLILGHVSINGIYQSIYNLCATHFLSDNYIKLNGTKVRDFVV